ncbi:battenin-like, partial [Saccoglossus kowalevskii]
FGNVALMLLQIFFHFLPSIWIIFGLIFYEGLLGGAAYVNTFFRISKEVKPEHKEFSMSVTSVADTTGVAISAFISVRVHNYLCSL